MRYGPDRKQLTRGRILQATSRQIREGGIANVSLKRVMADVGLTHGGFYAHFKSKDDFLMASVQGMFIESPYHILEGQGSSARDALSGFVDYYLSPTHRDTLSGGCPLPFLSADAPRLAPGLRACIAGAAAKMRGTVASHLRELRHDDPEGEACSCVGEMIGAVILARAEPDLARSDAILGRTRNAVRRRFGLEAGG